MILRISHVTDGVYTEHNFDVDSLTDLDLVGDSVIYELRATGDKLRVTMHGDRMSDDLAVIPRQANAVHLQPHREES